MFWKIHFRFTIRGLFIAYHSKCVDRWLLRRQGSCPVCKYRIHRNHDDPETDNEENHADEEGGDYDGVNEGGTELPNSQDVATGNSANEVSQAAYSAPLDNADVILGDLDAEYDDNDGVAPLLSRSEPVASWLSGGLLPSRGTTWLGNGTFMCELPFPSSQKFHSLLMLVGVGSAFHYHQRAAMLADIGCIPIKCCLGL